VSGTASVETLLRFALRTGRYVVGETGARIQAERRRKGIVLYALDLDERRAASIERWARAIPVPTGAPLDGAAMAAVTGRPTCNVIFVYHRELARAIGNALGAQDKI